MFITKEIKRRLNDGVLVVKQPKVLLAALKIPRRPQTKVESSETQVMNLSIFNETEPQGFLKYIFPWCHRVHSHTALFVPFKTSLFKKKADISLLYFRPHSRTLLLPLHVLCVMLYIFRFFLPPQRIVLWNFLLWTLNCRTKSFFLHTPP